MAMHRLTRDEARRIAVGVANLTETNVQAAMRHAARCAPFDTEHAAAWERDPRH